jgi:hypothetical protein
VHRGGQLYMHGMCHSAAIRFLRQRFISIRPSAAARQRGCGKGRAHFGDAENEHWRAKMRTQGRWCEINATFARLFSQAAVELAHAHAQRPHMCSLLSSPKDGLTTTRTIWPRDWDAERVGGLKYFKSHNVQGKEYSSIGYCSLAAINPIGAIIRPNKKVRYCSKKTSPDQHMVCVARLVSSSEKHPIGSQRYITRST